jgi:hypothetical protein
MRPRVDQQRQVGRPARVLRQVQDPILESGRGQKQMTLWLINNDAVLTTSEEEENGI